MVAVAALVLLGGAAWFWQHSGTAPGPRAGKGGPAGPVPVEVVKAAASRLSDDVSAVGTLLADEATAIAPETSGRIAAVNFADGATVATGDILFRLDTDLAQADLSDARARLALAQANYQRSQKLRAAGTVPQATFDSARTDVAVAQTAVDSASVRLAKLTITAPFPGTLGFRTVSPGAYVTPGMALVQIAKIDTLQAEFSVPELFQPRIHVGDQVALTADALPGESFTAAITALDPAIDAAGRALKLRARLDNAARKLRPGMLVRLLIKGQLRDAVTVPDAALVPRGQTMMVYILDGTTAREVKVETGKRILGLVEVKGALAAGQPVVVAGQMRLRDGAAVTVVTPNIPAQ